MSTGATKPPRIAPYTPPFDPAVEALLAEMMPTPTIPPIALFRLMAKNFDMARSAWRLGAYGLGEDCSLPVREREVLIDRVCARLGCEYEWSVHVSYFGPQAGLTQDEIASLTRGTSADPCWASPRERSIIDAVDALVDHHDASDQVWADLQRSFSEPELLDILCLTGWYHAICFLARATRLPLERGAPQFSSYDDRLP